MACYALVDEIDRLRSMQGAWQPEAAPSTEGQSLIATLFQGIRALRHFSSSSLMMGKSLPTGVRLVAHLSVCISRSPTCANRRSCCGRWVAAVDRAVIRYLGSETESDESSWTSVCTTIPIFFIIYWIPSRTLVLLYCTRPTYLFRLLYTCQFRGHFTVYCIHNFIMYLNFRPLGLRKVDRRLLVLQALYHNYFP